MIYYTEFFNKNLSKLLYNRLLKKVKWEYETLNFMGKHMVLKRRSAWYADYGNYYKYSGVTKKPHLWNREIKFIKFLIEKETEYFFNSVLLNEYSDGTVGMGWHSDDEKELGLQPIIASISLGASRDMYFKNNKSKKIKLFLENGSLLIMKGKTQSFWKHTIPKRLKIKDGRINLTFRSII